LNDYFYLLVEMPGLKDLKTCHKTTKYSKPLVTALLHGVEMIFGKQLAFNSAATA